MSRRLIRPLAAISLVLLVPLACGAWLFTWGDDGDQFVPTLDALAVPPTWEAVHTEVRDGGWIIKPRATRYYFVDADPQDSVAMARGIAEAAGFVVHPHVLSLNGCEDGFPAEAMDSPCGPVVADECRSNGGLPIDCTVQAARGLDSGGEQVERLWINLDGRGSSFTVGQGDDRRQVRDPTRALVRITADHEWREAFRLSSALLSASGR